MEKTRPVFNFFADIGEKIVSPRRLSRQGKLFHGLEAALADLMERHDPKEIIVLEYTGSTVVNFFQKHPPRTTKIDLTLFLRDPDASWDFTSPERAEFHKMEIRRNIHILTHEPRFTDWLNITVKHYPDDPFLAAVFAKVKTHTGVRQVGWIGIYQVVQLGDAKDYDISNSEMVKLVNQTFWESLSERVVAANE